ncbi:hypothetical protein ZHAS_00004424 [Anopheles sinensis]|uniref:Uncharacterized protein n=1 Tax=Anopheles sinensis TaxID=74873 RepID=A0A084VGW8_ANOSI|nr:hypothetical protein ZHAS_00004424 [Anopheles sinensis]
MQPPAIHACTIRYVTFQLANFPAFGSQDGKDASRRIIVRSTGMPEDARKQGNRHMSRDAAHGQAGEATNLFENASPRRLARKRKTNRTDERTNVET